jgi:hypothetical protein
MQKPIVVSLFDLTGASVQPWADAGYECHIIDRQHDGGDLRKNVRGHNLDLLNTTPNDILCSIKCYGRKVAFVSAYPDCSAVACSGARWFKGKGLRALADSVHMFATAADFCEAVGAPYYIENPVSTISTYWRKPDYSFHPWQYSGLEPADCYTKKTCLWTGGGFNMPEPDCDPDCQPDDRIHKAAPGPERKNFRSATPAGFARAVFMANAPIQSIKLEKVI